MRTMCWRFQRLLRSLRPSIGLGAKLVIALFAIGSFLFTTTPTAHAGRNAGGALVVHTDDSWDYSGACDWFDYAYPGIECPDLDIRTDVDINTPALIWFIAAFPEDSDPSVMVIYFGHDHSMPQYYHNRWGYCGPAGTIQIPDSGWPDAPATAGNSVAFGSPVAGDILFPFYYFDVWGEPGWHYCTAINPVGGYAGFVDDSNPPELDEIGLFGCAYYGTDDGYNECPPVGVPPGACCYEDGSCEVWPEADCADQGGTWYGDEYEECDPNPCPPPPTGACCYGCEECIVLTELECYDLPDDYLWIESEICEPNPCPPTATEESTWGRIKAGYRR